MADDMASIRALLKALVWDEEGGDRKTVGNSGESDEGEGGDKGDGGEDDEQKDSADETDEDGDEEEDADYDADDSDERDGKSENETGGEEQDDKEQGDAKSSSPRPSSPAFNSPLRNGRPFKRDPGPKSVVLVMHTTGAVPGTQAAINLTRTHRLKEGKKGGIISVVFINGLLVDKGESLTSAMESLGVVALPKYAEVHVGFFDPVYRFAMLSVGELGPKITNLHYQGATVRLRDNAGATFYSDFPPAEAAQWSSKHGPQSLSVYSAVVQSTYRDLDVPVTYVLCTEDPWVEITGEMVATMEKASWTIKTMESRGSPLFSRVRELGDIILQAGQVG